MTPILREARPDDAANLAALSIQVWLHTYAKSGIRPIFSSYVLTEFTVENFTRLLESNEHLFILCEIDAHLVGFVRLNLNAPCPSEPHSLTEIATLYVQEHFLRRGIGTSLLERALRVCDERGFDKVWLSVNRENLNAIKFYEAQHFTPNGSQYFELGDERHENHIFLQKTGTD